MISEYKLDQFLEISAKKKRVTWSEIEDFFGEGFIETEDFDGLLYKLDREGIKVINDSFNKNNKDDLIFESYIDFDDQEMIARREELGGKKELNPNKAFKEYLINAFCIMDYETDFISHLYGISEEILKDWIFEYKNRYEVIVPHCYFNGKKTDLWELQRKYKKSFKFHHYASEVLPHFHYDFSNKFFISSDYEIPENIKTKFTEMYRQKNKTDEEIAIALKIYPSLVKQLKDELLNINKKDYFYKKALKKIPMWAQKPYQDNHKIIRAFFKAYHRFDEPPTKDMIRELCDTDSTCYVDNFQATYSSLKADGPTTNGKVFIDDGIYVQIWEEVEDVLLKFEKYFYNDELDK